MIAVRSAVAPQQVRFDARHVLFVEGGGGNAIDPTALRVLLGSQLRIEPLGASFAVTSVAQALHPFHPNYYFLIDRDHHDDDFVERCWRNFPNEDELNLLVWRRRELENYFLEPSYLAHSKYIVADVDRLREGILERAQRRLYLDVANRVIVWLRETLKKNRIRTFTNPERFATRDMALQALRDVRVSDRYRGIFDERLSDESIESAFLETLRTMTGIVDETSATERLRFGHGRWIDMIRGKKLLADVLSSNLFRVEDIHGNIVSGEQRRNEVVKDLLRRDDAIQPSDFVELRRLIKRRIDMG